jgi:hypothetical protein
MNEEQVKFGMISSIRFRDLSSFLVHPETTKIIIAAL